MKSAQLLATTPPLDTKDSHGFVCGAANNYSTQGFTRSGKTAANGHFSYTFVQKGQSNSKETITVKGRFVNSTHATGTFRDVFTSPANGVIPGNHCDTGAVKFSASHS